MTQLIPGEYDTKLNGVRIHYTVRGSGPALIAHSGGPGADARMWDDFGKIDEFCTVIAIHPRGSGLSGSAPDNAYLLPDYAADVEALRLHLGLDKPILIGWSHGGMVVQQFAFMYPNSLFKLILFDTAAYIGEFLGDIEAAVKNFKGQPWFEESFTALKQLFDGEYRTDEDLTQLAAHYIKFYFKQFNARAQAYIQQTKEFPFRIVPVRAFIDEEAATMDLRPCLKNITVPTLILVGRHDFITNVAMAEEMCTHIPNARLEIFEDSGHFALVEEPEKFYRVVKQFVLDA